MEVYTLIGPSGSGKSHRASLLAMRLGAEAILDDGLLICNGKILAGRSAKAEKSKIAAVRRAIFFQPEDAAEMRSVLSSRAPERLLLLGTSEAMAHRIVQVLGLPEPVRSISIDQIASLEDIAHAHRIRLQQGKHVIPAPTVEVRRSLAGYLVHPLRLIWRAHPSRHLVIEKSVVRPTWSSLGRFTLHDAVLDQIATYAAGRCPGVVRVKKTQCKTGEMGLDIVLEVTAQWGAPLPSVLHTIQIDVKQAVEGMTALHVNRVDVTVSSLERLPGQSI